MAATVVVNPIPTRRTPDPPNGLTYPLKYITVEDVRIRSANEVSSGHGLGVTR
jgi:hypothetical protein